MDSAIDADAGALHRVARRSGARIVDRIENLRIGSVLYLGERARLQLAEVHRAPRRPAAIGVKEFAHVAGEKHRLRAVGTDDRAVHAAARADTVRNHRRGRQGHGAQCEREAGGYPASEMGEHRLHSFNE